MVKGMKEWGSSGRERWLDQGESMLRRSRGCVAFLRKEYCDKVRSGMWRRGALIKRDQTSCFSVLRRLYLPWGL